MDLLKVELSLDVASLLQHFHNPLCHALKMAFPSPCRNLSLGLTTKARGCKVAGQEKDPGVTSYAPRSAKSVRE